MYGDYLKSHNVQPHRGPNSPKNIQSYNVALMKGQELGAIFPYPPKSPILEAPANYSRNQNSTPGNTQSECQIYQEENHQRSLPIRAPNLYNLEKFGGKGIKKVGVHARLERSHAGEKENEEEEEAQRNHRTG
jgi:hypothetical protein